MTLPLNFAKGQQFRLFWTFGYFVLVGVSGHLTSCWAYPVFPSLVHLHLILPTYIIRIGKYNG